MPKTTVIICIDGLDPQYLEQCDAPTIKHLGSKGFVKVGRAMLPSVTNVNNVSLVTGLYPKDHGITSNYWLIRETGQEVYMESGEYILAETIFQRAERKGAASLLVTAKDKLRGLLGRGATLAVSSERPPEWVAQGLGAPPEIYSLEVNGWVIRAASYILSRQPAEIAYIATTDYAMHTYPPGATQSQKHISLLAEAIAELVDSHPDIQLFITADHGMSSKGRMVNLEEALAKYDVKGTAVPIIKDRYVVHHSNLGGCIFIYLRDVGQTDEAVKVLRETPGVEEALPREEAAAKYHLRYERIGDILVLGEEDVVFGDPAQVELPPNLRSHGSLHEDRVPIIGYGGDFEGFDFQENRDVGRYVMEQVLGK